MGSITKTETISGPTLQEAFKRLQEEDGHELGHDIYSGSWANSQGVREVSAEEYERNKDNTTKYEVAIAKCTLKPIANTNKIKTDVLRHPNHGTRKWKTVYVAVPAYAHPDMAPISIMEEKLADAITKARAYVEKNPDTKLKVQIGKKLIGEKDAELCAEITYKKSSRERDGQWEVTGTMSY